MSRVPSEALQQRFELCRSTPSDINEHLDILRQLASECDHVTEMGVRTGMSTVALLAAQPAELISWDFNPYAIISQNIADLVVLAGQTFFQPRVGDTLKIRIEPTDMLFIDTLHTFTQLKAELIRHADPIEDPIRKYLVFHDTVTFGSEGEDKQRPGLRAAVKFFHENHAFPVWQLVEDRQNNNGLIILRNVRHT